jgi:hypothetical protein
MKVELFKKLIKEAVAEAVREELNNILNESYSQPKLNQIQETKTLSFTSEDVNTTRSQIRERMGSMFGFNQNQSTMNSNSNLTVDNNSDNPFLAFIADAGANMTPQERAGLQNLG